MQMDTKLVAKLAWLPVLLVTLGLSNWSLAIVAHAYGVPYILGYTVSIAFDGAALRAGSIALFYARTSGESGLGARMFVILVVSASAFFNAQHARINHDPVYAQYFYGAFPIIAYVLFELESRKERRVALRRAGRIPEPLTPLGRWKWLFFPLASLKTLRNIERSRLERIEARALATGANVNLDRVFINPDNQRIRVWAKVQGYQVPERGPLSREIQEAFAANIPTSTNGHSHDA